MISVAYSTLKEKKAFFGLWKLGSPLWKFNLSILLVLFTRQIFYILETDADLSISCGYAEFI
jgi:hypothetical protein